MSVRKIDFDVGKPPPPPPPEHRSPWSIAVLGVPLPMVGVILVQTVTVVFYLGQQSSRLEAVIESNKELKDAVYRSTDASRDLALRDDRISELGRRVEILERYIDGRRK